MKHKVEIQRIRIQKENQEKESTKNELENLLRVIYNQCNSYDRVVGSTYVLEL